ncbi:MAG: dihydroorotate dehydrogenase [Patescibacteria group bacterium]
MGLAGIRMDNPVVPASGTWGIESQKILLEAGRFRPGALVTKSVTIEPRPGNPPPRLRETASGLINWIGLAGPGIDRFLADELSVWLSFGQPVIVSIAGKTPQEYVHLAQCLGDTRISGIELNISCPNVGGTIIGTDPQLTAEIVRATRLATGLPLIVKLTPNVTDIAAIAKAAEREGANAIVAVNTFTAMRINPNTGQVIISGGLSGPAIMPQALRKVWEVCRAVKIPVIGMGGIASASDALEFLWAGASAVAVGTANFGNPLVMAEIIEGIAGWLEQNGFGSLEEFRQKKAECR